MKRLLFSCAAAAALAPAALAEGTTDLSSRVHDIIVTSPVPQVQVTVRNVAASTDPADRDLRMVSDDPMIAMTGQVWCNSYDYASNWAQRAQLLVGETTVAVSEGGADPFPLGIWDNSEMQYFEGEDALENFDLEFVLDLPHDWDPDQAVTLFFNPVALVENHLETFVENNSGTEADFLREDAVFETTVTLSAAGWCRYDSNSIHGEYAGLRQFDMPIRVFYQGDADIADVPTIVGTPGAVTTPVPDRAREVVSTRGSDAEPPARTDPPARARPVRRATRPD
ncbi:hypothetical protein DDZ18_09415 [Marinicauda salina]|uniref:Uncharacterized protein n=1 Tax=Marinicauda salina TaxID=2135793 RepID=A0A2U2BSD1_9PROT|nr:hypothetical protein [Marinicauda salina]PWE16923.1 hypothetical protein DDZ18_09415 [Marinicauda salina]